MINIGTTDFHLNVPSLPVEEFESYSTQLFDEWEDYDPEFQPTLTTTDDDGEPNTPTPSSPKPKIHVIRPDQYRVEIWRESKKSQRNIRVRKI